MNILPIKRCTFLCLTISTTLLAQEPDSSPTYSDTTVSLEKIVITATRSKRLVSETPASVSVITKKEIASSPAKTVEDLLITQTGVQASRSAAIGEGIPSSIIIRGIPGSLAASRTLILVDGIPTNASGTPFLIVNEIPMEAIERIEIVRGPHSSLYGANAFGGVVNILTQEVKGKLHGGIATETSYPFTVLDQYYAKERSLSKSIDTAVPLSYHNVTGTVSGGNDKAGVVVSTGYRSIGNYLLRDSSMVQKKGVEMNVRGDNHDYKEFRIFAKSKYYCSDKSDLSLHIRYFDSDLGYGKTKKIMPDSMDVNTKGNKFLIGPQVKIAFSNNILFRAGGFYRQVIGEFINEDTDTGNVYVQSYWKSRTNDWQIESQGIITLGSGNVLTVGLEVLDNNAHFGATENAVTGTVLPKAFPVNKGIVNSAVFIQNECDLFKQLKLVPAVRIDHHSEFGSAVSPKLGILYKLSNHIRVKTSGGRSFRAPSLAELYMPDLTVMPNFKLRANPALEPENLWGFDGGIEVVPTAAVTVKLDAYYNSMKDLISQVVFLQDTVPYVTHRNISAAWSKGIEGEIGWRLLAWMVCSANATVQHSLDKTYNTSLDYIPDYTAGCEAKASRRFTSFTIDGKIGFKLVGKRNYLDFANPTIRLNDGSIIPYHALLNPYHTVNVACKISSLTGLSCTVAAQNIFNEKYQEALGALATGRFATLKLGFAF
ncbi:MAG: TonB-dependent receptor [Chitinispirillaceae bacterium]|nr:TonB-dependent receptor [Chitinispirillaceae bacterium]